jgi:tRNA G18 (ribose-2'-O)-methylase SpoU
MRKLTMPELGRQSHDQFRRSQKNPIVLILDNLRSGLNVGSIFRTADAFALEKIILCGITPQPPHREILKTALGATDSVEWEYHTNISEVISDLKSRGYRIWPVEQTDRRRALDSFEWTGSKPIAFIFGNEVSGVSDSALALLEESIEIPQFGTKHSLNVAVSVGIVVWHVISSASLNISAE